MPATVYDARFRHRTQYRRESCRSRDRLIQEVLDDGRRREFPMTRLVANADIVYVGLRETASAAASDAACLGRVGDRAVCDTIRAEVGLAARPSRSRSLVCPARPDTWRPRFRTPYEILSELKRKQMTLLESA